MESRLNKANEVDLDDAMSLEFALPSSAKLSMSSSEEDTDGNTPAKMSDGSTSSSETGSVNKHGDDSSLLGEKQHESDKEFPVLAQRFKALLKYIEKFEEVRNKEQLFSKPYDNFDKQIVEQDWSNDNFLQKHSASSKEGKTQSKSGENEEHSASSKESKTKSKSGENEDSMKSSPKKFGIEFGMILTSYDYLPLRQKIAKELHSAAGWLTIPRTPEKKYEPDDDVKKYLAHLKMHDSEDRYQECEDVCDMIPLLRREAIEEDLSTFADDRRKRTLGLLLDIMDYHASEPFNTLQPAYQKLFDWQASAESDDHALILGFGHVRVFTTTRRNKSEYERRLVSGPLFEVPVDVDLDEEYRLVVKPKVYAEIELNEEVMSAIVSTGICNSKVIEQLYELAKNTDASSLDPFNLSSFERFLQIASRLQSGTKVRRATDFNVHDPPEDLEKVVITDASCLFARKKKNTIFSNDARALGDAFRDGKLKMTEPIKGLLLGPDYCHEKSTTTVESDRLVYALPSSERQRQIGIRLLAKGEPLVNVVGPPGTGKTHSIANIAATALSEGKSVIVCSSNDKALKALMDRLPPKLQSLALDMSCVKDQDVSQLHFALDKMIESLRENQQDEHGNAGTNVRRLEKAVKALKEKRHSVYVKLHGTTATSRELLEDDQSRTMVKRASDIAATAPWLVTAIFAGKIKDIPDILENLKVFNKSVSFGHSVDHFLTKEKSVQELKDRVEKHLEKLRVDIGGNSKPVFCFEDTLMVHDKHLVNVKVGGKKPINRCDWEIVLASLKVIESCILPCREAKDAILQLGEDHSFHASKTGMECLVTSAELETTFGGLHNETKQTLLSIFESSVVSYELQAEYQDLSTRIQNMESELVFLKVIWTMNQKLRKGEISTLIQMSQRIAKMKSSHLVSGGTCSEKGTRYLADFQGSFQQASKFMPFLVMTIEQASQFLAPDHVCDIGIIDEASQSSCTAINFMARCKQLLPVGDDKQVSPSTVGISEANFRTLKQCSPGISTDEQLLPEFSFFDLTQAAFSCGDICLNEHFRCDPDIIAISNNLYYNGILVPMRLRGHSKAVEVKHVKGGSNSKGKNEVEAKEVAKDVEKEIRRTVDSSKYQTIAVISMGGAAQHKLIQQLVEDKVGDIIDEFGSDIVDRHQILYGTPKECQGNERDIAFVSFVASTPEKKGNKKIAKLPQDDNWKEANVGLTRAKNRMVLYRSFALKDLQPRDTRNQIFRAATQGGGGCLKKSDAEGDILTFSRHHLVSRTVEALSTSLKTKGYLTRRHGGKVWSEALCIESSSDTESSPWHVLLHVESCGETEREWMKMFDEQLSLERAGRLCLRVNCLSLLLNFDDTFRDVVSYLEKKAISKSHKRGYPEGSATTTTTGAARERTMPHKRLRP